MNPAVRASRAMTVLSFVLLCAAIAWVVLVPGEAIVGILFLIAAFGAGTNAVIVWRARNRRPEAIQQPVSSSGVPRFVPDDMLAADGGRPIPWRGGTGTLTVKRPSFGQTSSILVNGDVIATPARAIIANPWVECQIPETDPALTVVQVQQERYVFRVLVFANGVSLGDGSSLDAWRARQPRALDEFEQVFNPPMYGVPGAIGLGVFCFLVALGTFAAPHKTEVTIAPFWIAVFLALSFVVPSGWWMVVVRFIRWLRTKRTWSWRLRRFMVFGAMLCALPVVLGVMSVVAAAAGITK